MRCPFCCEEVTGSLAPSEIDRLARRHVPRCAWVRATLPEVLPDVSSCEWRTELPGFEVAAP